MYDNYEEIKLLIPKLIEDKEHSKLKKIADIEERYTFFAEGVNVDYILYMIKNGNGKYEIFHYNIDKIYSDIFDKIYNYYNSKNTEFEDIVEYVKNTCLISKSNILTKETEQEYFNYCLGLSDRYIPNIYIDINYRIEKLIELKKILDMNYQDKIDKEKKIDNIRDIKSEYRNSKIELKKEICNYIALWIHAYRFLTARKKMNNSNSEILSFSHRYRGWSKPRQIVNNDLSIEFKTNFGYGNSSYFYLLLIYRGIQIFPFMEWVNYKYAQASEMEKYTKRYQKITTIYDEKNNRDIKKLIIEQEYWDGAFEDLVTACNISQKSSDDFIQTYIISALNELIEELEEVFNLSDSEANKKYRDFDYGFSISFLEENYIKSIKLMHVKGAVITGALGLIGHITKLKEIVDTSCYVRKILYINNRVSPLLVEIIPECQKLIHSTEIKISSLGKEMADIWTNRGLAEYKKNIKSGLQEKQKEFELLEDKHNNLSKSMSDARQDLGHSRNILKSIERYIRNIDNYIANTKS